ncbi:unnamed protein product [Ectocarpus sp. 12 AP-2014]
MPPSLTLPNWQAGVRFFFRTNVWRGIIAFGRVGASQAYRTHVNDAR